MARLGGEGQERGCLSSVVSPLSVVLPRLTCTYHIYLPAVQLPVPVAIVYCSY